MRGTERSTGLLDTMARAAAQACGTTAALLALSDGDGVVCASHPGFATAEEALAVAGLCGEADAGWRFTAACPLVAGDGHTIGVLAVADRAPREDSGVPSALETLAGRVVAELEHLDDSERLKRLGRRYHRTRKALCEANEHLQCFLANRNDLVFSVDAAGRFLQTNEAFTKLLGYSEAELAGRTVWDLVAPESRRHLIEIYRRVFAGAAIYGIEAAFVAADGSRFVLEGSAGACWAHGQPAHVRGIYNDITLRKEAEDAVARHVEELTRSNTELEQLAYVAAHDMQEPLRMITSYLQLLERRYKGRLDQDADEFIRFAVDGANRLSQMIRDLLASAKVVYTGRLNERVDCSAAMRNVAAMLDCQLDEAGAVLTWDPLPAVEGSSIQIGQLFMNLIANAIKYRREARLEIHVSAEERDRVWAFAVKDNGIGIAPQNTERIFRLFRRGSSRAAGAGIGLAVCKKIVERHGGEIWVDSEEGSGSVFHFTIPKTGGTA